MAREEYLKSNTLFYIVLTFLFTSIMLAQNTRNKESIRSDIPPVYANTYSAPGYCASYGGSTSYERITNVDVVETAGNRLDITVNVFIANPTNCVSGEPCSAYDSSPEYVNVWIDWDGDKLWEPFELVLNQALTGYKSISYAGTMVAKGSVSIPPNAQKPTWLRANLGWGTDPQDPCMQYWSYGNVVDQQVLWNMKVQEISADNNIVIPETTPKPFTAFYDQNGNLLNTVGDKTVAGGMEKKTVNLPVKLVSFPSNIGDNARTECKWSVVNTSLKGSKSFIGKSGNVPITLPQKIGFYPLQLRFIFRNDQNNKIGEQVVDLELWVSYDTPKISLSKKIWLQKSISWAQGAVNDNDIAYKIMDAIHNKSGWRYINGGNSWFKLIEGSANWGNCRNMAQVWTNVLNVLGVGGIKPAGHQGRNGKGFMSYPGYVSFGNLNSSNGNAYAGYFGSYDRWVFGSHWFGEKGGTYYDPVFNITGNDLYYHSQYDIESVNGNTKIAGAATLYDKGSSFEFDHGNWPKFSYSISSSLDKAAIAEAEGAIFNGEFIENVIDIDADGVYDQLGAVIGTDITVEGNYSVIGYLEKDGEFITGRSLYTDPVNWNEQIGSGIGTYQISPMFSGEEIYQNGVNGPFIMPMFILDTAGLVVAADTFISGNYSYTEFGEYPTRILNIAESASDTNGDSYIDEIIVSVEYQNTISDSFFVIASFINNQKVIVSESNTSYIPSGFNMLTYSLSMKNIEPHSFSGQSVISVQVLNMLGENIASSEIVTAEYTSDQFTPPIVRMTGENSDDIIDVGFDEVFDSLRVILGIQFDFEGIYSAAAWLRSENDEEISWSEVTEYYGAGNNNLIFKFPGSDINQSGIDGPYKIGYAFIRDSLNVLYSDTNIYTTNYYAANQFIEAKPDLITSTGNYSESIIDSNMNSLIDTLVVEIGVIPRDSGNVVALGRLVDSKGETILWASTTEFLQASYEQNLHLKFDGRFIYGSLMNGPYQLKDLQIYHVGDPSLSIEITSSYETSSYNYDEFEPSGVIVGKVQDNEMENIPNVFLYIENTDNDYSNLEGEYNIVVTDSGNYTLKIEGPDSLDLIWSIFINSEFNSNSDSVTLPVSIGQITTVDFVAPIDITGRKDITINDNVPAEYNLGQNYPNPFNSLTTIYYSIPIKSFVNIKIYDMLGKELLTLINENKNPGRYSVNFDAGSLSTGIYLYKITAGEYKKTKKMLFLK